MTDVGWVAGGMVHVYVAMQRADDAMERPNVPGLPRTSSRNTCPRKRGHGTRHLAASGNDENGLFSEQRVALLRARPGIYAG